MSGAERSLQAEIMLRLKSLPVIALPIPNSMFFPARNPAEREIMRRVIYIMKNSGQITPGAPDLVIIWSGGAAMVELKRAAQRTLLGKRPRGRASDTQIEMAARASELGINHAFITSWDELRERLSEWGVGNQPRAAQLDPVDRVTEALLP